MKSFIRQLADKPIIIGDFNWDIYTDKSLNKCYSIAKPEHPDCKDSIYGDRNHLLHLLNNDFLSWDSFTDKGREFMAGAFSRLFTDNKGKSFHITRFYG